MGKATLSNIEKKPRGGPRVDATGLHGANAAVGLLRSTLDRRAAGTEAVAPPGYPSLGRRGAGQAFLEEGRREAAPIISEQTSRRTRTAGFSATRP